MFSKIVNLSKAIIFAAIIALFFAFSASAQVTGLTNKSVAQIIAGAIDWLLGIVAGLAILFIIIGGIYYTTAAGDDQRMETGKSMITYSIIGLLFILISYSIVITVNKFIAG